MRHLPVLCTSFTLLAALTLSSVGAAQSANTRVSSSGLEEPDGALCLGFAFGAWSPPLDWTKAGHGQVDTSKVPRAPGGRGWATTESGKDADSSFVLFPAWWPAGVLITLGRQPRSAADTVIGRAMALVADGAKTAPTSVIRAYEGPCRR